MAFEIPDEEHDAVTEMLMDLGIEDPSEKQVQELYRLIRNAVAMGEQRVADVARFFIEEDEVYEEFIDAANNGVFIHGGLVR